MTTTIFSITPFRNVHDINVTSKNGRSFIIAIYKDSNNSLDSEVTVLDNVSSLKGSWLYKTSPTTPSVSDNFKAAIELIKNYLASVDSKDSILDVHNPCNCPFISDTDQDKVLSGLGQNINVRVN